MAVVNEKKKIQETVVQPAAKTVQTAQKVQPISAGKVADGKQQGYKKVNPYAGLTGVSANTAQQIASAQHGYQSPYSGMINNILQQITNPQEFNYEFNKDNLFNAYQDLYTQQGRQASLDAQGQAAGLTGGYGNSYGAAVGNQAYQQWLTKLYDKGLELYDRARQRYNDDWNQLLGQYDVLNGQDQQGYQQWLNNLNYWTGLGQTENQGYLNDQQLHMQQQDYALGICQSILANGQMPSDALLAQAGLSREDAMAMMAMMEPAGGSGGSGGGGGGSKINQQIGNIGSTIAGAMSGAAAGVGNVAQNMFSGLGNLNTSGTGGSSGTPIVKNRPDGPTEVYLKKLREMAK